MARVKEYFERTASEWDEMRLAWYDERVIEELTRRVGAERHATIVDVGTGTGFVAAGMAPRVTRVVGVDSSPAMLAVARQNLDHLGISNVQLTDADISDMPLSDDSVDAAVANMVLHHVEQPARVLREMSRVTRPGRWVAITDAVAHRHEWMRTEHADVWLGFGRRQVEAFFKSAGLRAFGYARLGFQ